MDERGRPCAPEAALWEAQRVQAGPLVKELRMRRARFSAADSPEERRDKIFVKRHSSLLRDPVDRLELRLALIGWDARHYTLHFDAAHLPADYAGTLLAWQAFLRRCKRQREGAGLPGAFLYAKTIEGLHGDHRWHIHLVCSAADFSAADIGGLWGLGDIHDENVIRDCTGFRRLARYFLKERRDGLRLPLDKQPLSWSAALRLPGVECWQTAQARVRIPAGAVALQQPSSYSNPFGGFSYASYLMTDKSRACAHARTILQRGVYRRTNPEKEAKTG